MFSLANKQTHRHMPSNQLSEHYCAGDCLQSTLEYFQISFQFQHQSFLFNLKLNYKSLILTPHQPRIKCWNIEFYQSVTFSTFLCYNQLNQLNATIWNGLVNDRQKEPSCSLVILVTSMSAERLMNIRLMIQAASKIIKMVTNWDTHCHLLHINFKSS